MDNERSTTAVIHPSPFALRPSREKGIVLFIALIVLVAMTLAGIALTRSVSTTNLIAGNLAFSQSATYSGDTGIETATAWLEQNNTGANLQASNTGMGYVGHCGTSDNPAAGQTWSQFWDAALAGQAYPQSPSADAAGNRVQFVIHRLCQTDGNPTTVGVNCASSPTSTSGASSSKGAGALALLYNSQIYYRITSRIAGPRNTVSYVQAIVAM